MRSALCLPLFNGLAGLVVITRLTAEAEKAGWHGVPGGIAALTVRGVFRDNHPGPARH